MKKKDKKIPKNKKKIGEKKKIEIKEERKAETEKESELEEEIEEERSIPQFFQQLPKIKFSPVLEKVIRVGEANLEQQISRIPVSKDDEEKKVIRYGGEKTDYETTKPEERRNNFHYTETPTYENFLKNDKKETFVNFNKSRQEWENKERRRTMTEMERAGFDEMRNENKGKKYLTKGGY